MPVDLPPPAATVNLAAELIRRASVTPEDGGCQALVASRLERLGFRIESFNCGAVSNLYARRGTSKPHLTFVGHTDVVPVGELDHWHHPPFSATLADGFLHGRGAADMKGSVAAMITACERLFEPVDSQFNGSVSILLTSDEEGPAVDGTRHVLKQLEARGEMPQFCLVGEPTSESQLGDTIKVGRRGSLSGVITIHGRQGHVAYPHLADNPVHQSGELISALSTCNWNDGDEAFPETTLQITNAAAGVGADNVIPANLILKFNIRFAPAQTVEGLQRKITAICENRIADFHIEWKDPSLPYQSSGDRLATLVCDAVFDVLGIHPQRSTSGGTSDGRFVAAYGAQVVELGPLNATIHQVNECVSASDLEKLSRVYQRVLERLSEMGNKI